MSKILANTVSMPVMMPAAEVEMLSLALEGCHEYFEFGLGGSTLLAYNKSNCKINGVDSSKEWVDNVLALIPDKNRVCLSYIDIGPIKEFGYPVSGDKKECWDQYSKSIHNLAKAPDVVLIDGRFRVACAIQTVLFCIKNNLRPRIFLHDSSRAAYKRVLEILDVVKEIGSNSTLANGLVELRLRDSYDISNLENSYEFFKHVPK